MHRTQNDCYQCTVYIVLTVIIVTQSFAGKGAAPVGDQDVQALVGHEEDVVGLLLHQYRSLECQVSLAVLPSQAHLLPPHLCLSVQLEDLQTTSPVHVTERHFWHLTSNLNFDSR